MQILMPGENYLLATAAASLAPARLEWVPGDEKHREGYYVLRWLVDLASEIGRKHGCADASWVTDGNTTDATYWSLLRQIQDDEFEMPQPLGGEWAEGYSAASLMEDLGLADADDTAAQDALVAELCDEYEAAFSAAYEGSVKIACLKAVGLWRE